MENTGTMETILYFLPLSVLISLVCSGTRYEAFDDILKGALRIFAYLLAGTLVFAVTLQFSLQISLLFYSLLAALLAVLAYFTLREFSGWLTPGSPRKGEREDSGS